ncbi:RDD family protein [Sphaerotilus mobilis]|uniref:Putative RDD family membrane protein YckC n=1 Tax=Sphaerotilus mobilis TaxID=47994 RepID=A0A4Q7LU57_9BURK|nr:RDD family protein [Sphaerotilus mobilis]RZS58685.1 putative RDD family membrane protein YckC [Sphaerotilus mobilis]
MNARVETPGAFEVPGSTGAPGLRRRLAAMLYEGVLLFGVLMATSIPYAALTDQRHALQGRHGFQLFLFIVLGAYFIGFWTHGGQTLAMKTWQVQLRRADGAPVRLAQAALRYLASWLWFLPALGVVWLAGLTQGSAAFWSALLAGVLIYAGLSRLLPGRQFLHDVICGTRLVRRLPPPRPAKR